MLHGPEPRGNLRESRPLGNVGGSKSPLTIVGLLGAPALLDQCPHGRVLLPQNISWIRSPAREAENCESTDAPELLYGEAMSTQALVDGDGKRVHVYRSVVARSIENLGRLRKRRRERWVSAYGVACRKSCSQNTTTLVRPTTCTHLHLYVILTTNKVKA